MKNRLEYYSMYWNKYSPLPGINDIIINIRVDTSRDTPLRASYIRGITIIISGIITHNYGFW